MYPRLEHKNTLDLTSLTSPVLVFGMGMPVIIIPFAAFSVVCGYRSKNSDFLIHHSSSDLGESA